MYASGGHEYIGVVEEATCSEVKPSSPSGEKEDRREGVQGEEKGVLLEPGDIETQIVPGGKKGDGSTQQLGELRPLGY